MPFKSLGLSDPLVQGILATGYTAPTEIQSQAIPTAIEGKDLIGCAQTGTGKTAAFVLPILNRLTHEQVAGKKKFIRSLILTPTRELALQIEKCILDYSRFLHLRTLTVYGGVGIEEQLSALRRGVDIVVATPGRLLDHMQRRSIDLSHVEVLVLDEADRMFDMGFINDVRKIIAAMPKDRQTLLFSATMPPEVRRPCRRNTETPEDDTGWRAAKSHRNDHAAHLPRPEGTQDRSAAAHAQGQPDVQRTGLFTHQTRRRQDQPPT